MLKRLQKLMLTAGLLLACGSAYAGEQILECKLYIAESLDHESSYAMESSDSLLRGIRRGGICLFADGTVADKQFVMGINSRQDGAMGDAAGISVYTFESGDSLTLSFTGGWDKGPFTGQYTILHGTGVYDGASGGGTITGAESEWKSTSIVDIRIDVITAGS